MLEVMVSESIRERTPSSLVRNAGMGLGAEPGRYRSTILDAYRRSLDDRGTGRGDVRGLPGRRVRRCRARRRRPQGGPQHDLSVLVFRAARGGLPRFSPDVLEVWRPSAPDVRGRDRRHGLAGEDRPQETAEPLLAFLAGR
jgi:hypothetical protein